MHYLLFCLFSVYATKRLVKFEKIEPPGGKEPFFSTNGYDFYKISTNDDKIFYYQSIPFLIEAVKDLKAIFFEDLGLFEPFNKITLNNQIYTFDYSYIAGDIYFQAYSKGFFKKEYFYVAFKGSLENLSYNKVGNLLEVKGVQFLRVMDGYETIGICKKK